MFIQPQDSETTKMKPKFERNTGYMKDAKATNPRSFPKLSTGGASRIFTKHYSNLVLTLHTDTLALITWLIYQSDIDNTIIYTTKLLRQYHEAVNQAQELYTQKKIARSIPSARRNWKLLIDQQILIPVTDKQYLINPNLTYHRYFVQAQFAQDWVIGSTQEFINHARQRAEARIKSTRKYRKAA